MIALRPNLLQFRANVMGMGANEDDVDFNGVAVCPQFLALLRCFLVLSPEIKALEDMRAYRFILTGGAFELALELLFDLLVEVLVVVVASFLVRVLGQLR